MHLSGNGPRQPSMLLTCTTRPGSESWAPLPTFATRPAEIAIFRLSVAGSRPFAPHATAVLQAEELRRAQRYHRAVDYYRFLLGRAALRLVLGAYAELPPFSLHFEPGVTKKPLLREAPGLHYNVSHAGDWVVLAVSEVEVGIDVERLDPLFAFQDMLDHSFSPAEKAFVERSSLPHQAFYQLWTRKEAFVKATGRGIDAEFSQMPALVGQHQVASFCQVPRWVVSSFEVAAGYAAAIAYPAAPTSLLRFYDLGHEALCALYEAAGCCFTTA